MSDRTTATEVILRSESSTARVVWCGDNWRSGHSLLATDREAARHVRGRLGIGASMPHDRRNVIVTSCFGTGTVTSRGYPPWQWSYVHGRELVPEQSVARTLTDGASLGSLDSTIERCLARVRYLAHQVVKPATWQGAPLPRALHIDYLDRERNAWSQLAQATLCERMDAVFNPREICDALIWELHELGHSFGYFDENGSTWITYLQPGRSITMYFPDVPEIYAGRFVDVDEGSALLGHCAVGIDIAGPDVR